jgi:hypothetical protein
MSNREVTHDPGGRRLDAGAEAIRNLGPVFSDPHKVSPLLMAYPSNLARDTNTDTMSGMWALLIRGYVRMSRLELVT